MPWAKLDLVTGRVPGVIAPRSAACVPWSVSQACSCAASLSRRLRPRACPDPHFRHGPIRLLADRTGRVDGLPTNHRLAWVLHRMARNAKRSLPARGCSGASLDG
jgi:hypothetical protein